MPVEEASQLHQDYSSLSTSIQLRFCPIRIGATIATSWFFTTIIIVQESSVPTVLDTDACNGCTIVVVEPI